MNLPDYTQVDTQIFRELSFWQSFTVALSAFHSVTCQDIETLGSMRRITQETSAKIAENIIHTKGCPVPLDLVLDTERLFRSLPMLDEMMAATGTPDAYKALSYILGRHVEVTPLWTKDYMLMYPEPKGRLRVDGGEWYKTTHVDLSIECNPEEDVAERLLEVFYYFAPYSTVVRHYFQALSMQLNLEFDLALAESVIFRGELRSDQEEDWFSTFNLLGPTSVRSGETHTYRLLAGPDATYIDVQSRMCLSDAGSVTGNRVSFDTTVPKQVTLTAIGPVTRTLLISVFPRDFSVSHVTLEGVSDVSEPETYRVYVHYDGGFYEVYADVYAEGPVTCLGNVVTPISAGSATLRASVTIEGVTYNVAKLVTVLASTVPVYDLNILGVNTLVAGQSYNFTAQLSVDGVPSDVVAQWSAEGLTWVGSTVSVPSTLIEDYMATLVARYGDLVATKRVFVQVIPDPVLELIIDGPSVVYDQDRVLYICRVRYADVDVYTYEAVWQCDGYDVHDGVLKTGLVGLDKVVRLNVSYQGKSAQKIITIKRSQVVVNGIEIYGPDVLSFDTPTQYQSLAHYSNGNRIAVAVAWGYSAEHPLNVNNGLVTFDDLDVRQEFIATLTATYQGVVYERAIVVKPKPIHLTSLEIYEVIDGDVVPVTDTTMATRSYRNFAAIGHYDDGSSERVYPVWSLTTDDANVDEVRAYLDTNGRVAVRDSNAATRVTVNAQLYSVKTSLTFDVLYSMQPCDLVPTDSRIIGPESFYSSEEVDYTLATTFDGDEEETLLTSEWEIYVIDDGVWKAPSEVLQAGEKLSIDFGIVSAALVNDYVIGLLAIWECGSCRLEVKGTANVYAVAEPVLVIEGPDTVEVGGYAPFTASMYDPSTGQYTPVSATFTLESDATNLAVTGDGGLFVNGLVTSTTAVLRAHNSVYNKSAQKAVVILKSEPMYVDGLGTAQAIFDKAVPTGNTFTPTINEKLHVFVPANYPAMTLRRDQTQISATLANVTININGINTQWVIYTFNTTVVAPYTIHWS